MNYRHAFHAGNFADVVKHAVLTRILLHLCAKPAPFRFIDTHAGEGLYDLSSEAALRTGEWRDGVGRFRNTHLADPVAALLAPYRTIVDRAGEGAYPGSPLVAAALLRPGDRMICSEIVPAAAARLRSALPRRSKIVTLDGFTALNAFVPPVERRGVVLIDPPFEDPGEFGRLREALAAAYRKWSTGIFMIWYPLKTPHAGRDFAGALAAAGLERLLRLELWVDTPRPDARLAGAGLLIVNPPFPLMAEVDLILPALAKMLRCSRDAGWCAERLGPN